MKKLLIVLALVTSVASFSAGTAEVRLGLDINPKFSGDSKVEDVKTSWELAAEYRMPGLVQKIGHKVKTNMLKYLYN